jgi:hypothetical protein
MEHLLRAADVAAAIRGTLAGTRTNAQLGKWAYRAMLDHEGRTTPFDPRHRLEISAAVHQLIWMDEGPDYELLDKELQALMESLERLDQGSHAR